MVERSLQDRILTLRLARGRANALDLELLAALRDELDAVPGRRLTSGEPAGGKSAPDDPSGGQSARDRPAPIPPGAERVAAMILTGSGSIFSAGVDLVRLSAGGEEYIRRFFPLLSAVLYKLFTLPVPVVAALNGHAVAGGCLLAFACDYRLMADGNHRIGLPELSVGLPFPAVGHEIVRFAVPGHQVQSLMYTGATLAPGEALKAGFLDEVVSPASLEERSRAVAAQLGEMRPEVFAHTKRFLRSEAVDRLTRRSAAADAEAIAVWLSAEAQAHVRSYVSQVLGK